MAALDNNPLTTNLQAPQNFAFNLRRTPSLSYQCTSVKLPDITMNVADRNTQSLSVPFIGDHLVYSPIILTFKVDALMQNWLEIYNWMKGITNPKNGNKILTQLENNDPLQGYGVYSDLSLFQTDSQHNPLLTYTFERAMPIRLSGPKFDSTISNNIQYFTADVTFRYVIFTVEYA